MINFSSTKIFSQGTGWILLIFGIVLIGWTLFSSYHIFTDKTQPPPLFEIKTEQEEKEDLTIGKTGVSLLQVEIQKEMEKMIFDQLKDVLPFDTLPKLFNLIAWSIFAFILILGGGKISELGIKLIGSVK